MKTDREARPFARLGLLIAGIGFVTQAALAQSSAFADGRLLASNCYQCHGTNGKGPGFDRIAGKPAKEIYEELKEMQSGKEGKGIMPAHAVGYTESQLLQISSWLAQIR